MMSSSGMPKLQFLSLKSDVRIADPDIENLTGSNGIQPFAHAGSSSNNNSTTAVLGNATTAQSSGLQAVSESIIEDLDDGANYFEDNNVILSGDSFYGSSTVSSSSDIIGSESFYDERELDEESDEEDRNDQYSR